MPRCLIIDDAPLIRKVARLIMERLHFSVEDVADAAEGLARCQAALPDVILLDWDLPEMSALSFLAALQPLLASAPARPYVLYCTTENDLIDITRALHAGCDDVLLKPFTRADLEAKLGMLPSAAAVA